MKELLKQIKADYLFSSAMCIVLGLILVIWRGGVLEFLGTILAIVMIIIGAVYLCNYFLRAITSGFSMLIGIFLLAVGIWFIADPKVPGSLLPIVIGVLLLFHGIRAIKETLMARKYGDGPWGANLILAAVSVLCGLFCVFDAFHVMENLTIVVGIILIFNGISNIWICTSATHAARDYERRTGTIDTSFVEDGDRN